MLQKHIYICLPDRNYVQEDSCLPDQASVHEDLADTAPLAHDDLGCPIRRDKLYHDNMGATAKSLSGPPVSPSLFRSPRSSAPERPSPKAIQASIKESATLAAAISMQWKEEVSAMRRELADLRRDLCKELRAFNSNFNTFTQHYNTWSPQGGNMTARSDVSFDGGIGTGSRPGSDIGLGVGGFAVTVPNRGTGGARERKPQVSKVSVGTQARSKALVRQSTADAAVNCPDEKEQKRALRQKLPKQLSMDPSILAYPQPMYVESAIPLSLDPVLPGPTKAVEAELFDMTTVPSRAKADPEQQRPGPAFLTDIVTDEPLITHGGVNAISSKSALESPRQLATVKQEMLLTAQLISIDPTNEHDSNTEVSHSDDKKTPDTGRIERDKISIPYPVPVITVSPTEEHDYDNMSDSESLDPVSMNKPDPASQDPATLVHAGLEDQGPADSTGLESTPSESPMVSSCDIISQGPISICDAPTLNTVLPCNLEKDTKCPSIVVSEYIDTDSPESPNGSDTNPDPIVTLPDYYSDPPSEKITSVSTLASSSVETPLYSDPDFQDSEWPPLPEPLDTTPIYHSDLVHFDLVMLTSLDQDDLDSVFMDPEPEPFDLSVDYPSNNDDLDAPVSDSPVPDVDPAVLCSLDPPQSASSVCLDSVVEYHLANMPQGVASELDEVPLPRVTVTISPPSSVSPDTSLEMDFGPTSPASDPPPDKNPSATEFEDAPSGDLPLMEPNVMIVETLECMAVSQEYGELAEVETPGSLERSSSEQAFLWCRWQKRGQRQKSMRRSASVELWSGRYEYNSAEITYVSLTL